jgi:hypothetical protein
MMLRCAKCHERRNWPRFMFPEDADGCVNGRGIKT